MSTVTVRRQFQLVIQDQSQTNQRMHGLKIDNQCHSTASSATNTGQPKHQYSTNTELHAHTQLSGYI